MIERSEKPIDEIIGEEEFVPLLQESSKEFFRIKNFLDQEINFNLTKTFYAHLVEQAELFETILDDYDARKNKKYIYFTELVASLKNLGMAAFSLKHLIKRIPRYNLGDDIKELYYKSSPILDFLNQSVRALYKEAAWEAERLGVEVTGQAISKEGFKDTEVKKHLPHNLDEEETLDETKKIAEVTTKYLETTKKIKWDISLGKLKTSTLEKRVQEDINEEKIENLRSRVHTLQSKYDTHIKSTTIESSDKDLPKLRGMISVPLHLLGLARDLLHFYERHQDKIRYEESTEKISKIIDKDKVLHYAINFALFYARHFLYKGKALAQEIFNRYSNIVEYELEVPKTLGLHMRPAGFISRIVNHYGTKVTIKVGKERFDGGSILNIMSAGGLIAEEKRKTVIFQGDKRPLDDIKLFLEQINTISYKKLPEKLSYLRLEG